MSQQRCFHLFLRSQVTKRLPTSLKGSKRHASPGPHAPVPPTQKGCSGPTGSTALNRQEKFATLEKNATGPIGVSGTNTLLNKRPSGLSIGGPSSSNNAVTDRDYPRFQKRKEQQVAGGNQHTPVFTLTGKEKLDLKPDGQSSTHKPLGGPKVPARINIDTPVAHKVLGNAFERKHSNGKLKERPTIKTDPLAKFRNQPWLPQAAVVSNGPKVVSATKSADKINIYEQHSGIDGSEQVDGKNHLEDQILPGSTTELNTIPVEISRSKSVGSVGENSLARGEITEEKRHLDLYKSNLDGDLSDFPRDNFDKEWQFSKHELLELESHGNLEIKQTASETSVTAHKGLATHSSSDTSVDRLRRPGDVAPPISIGTEGPLNLSHRPKSARVSSSTRSISSAAGSSNDSHNNQKTKCKAEQSDGVGAAPDLPGYSNNKQFSAGNSKQTAPEKSQEGKAPRSSCSGRYESYDFYMGSCYEETRFEKLDRTLKKYRDYATSYMATRDGRPCQTVNGKQTCQMDCNVGETWTTLPRRRYPIGEIPRKVPGPTNDRGGRKRCS